MEITPLGNSGLKVTKIGLGLAALGRPGYINIGHDNALGGDKSIQTIESNAHKVLDMAWQKGVRFFDTARSYGKAELFLANWLKSRNINAEEITVSSKWGYVYTADWQVKADNHEIKYHTPENFRKQWKESQQILGRYINLYQIHSATLDSGVLDNVEILTNLMALKETGIKIGLSLSGVYQSDTLEKAIDVRIDGKRLFDTVQLTWNILENSTTEILIEAHKEGMGVIVKEALANGRIFHYQKQENDLVESMGKLVEDTGLTPDAIALGFVSQQPFVDTVLSGASSVEQLSTNLNFDKVNVSLLNTLNNLSESPEIYWQKRSELSWN